MKCLCTSGVVVIKNGTK